VNDTTLIIAVLEIIDIFQKDGLTAEHDKIVSAMEQKKYLFPSSFSFRRRKKKRS